MKDRLVKLFVPAIISFFTWALIGIICRVNIIKTLQIAGIIGFCMLLAFGVIVYAETMKS